MIRAQKEEQAKLLREQAEVLRKKQEAGVEIRSVLVNPVSSG